MPLFEKHEEQFADPAPTPVNASGNRIDAIDLPVSRAPIPPVARTQELAPAWLYTALLGNGRLLVCLDETGSPIQFFYPHVDAGPHVRSLLCGLQVKPAEDDNHEENWGPVLWLANQEWQHRVEYMEDATVISATSEHSGAGIRLERRLAVEPERDLLAIELRVVNLNAETIACRLVTCAGIDFELRANNNCSIFDPASERLFFFASDRYIAFACDAPVVGFACDKYVPGAADTVFESAGLGIYSNNEYAIGQVSSAVCHNLSRIAAGADLLYNLHFCFGHTLESVHALAASAGPAAGSITTTLNWWRERYAQSAPQTAQGDVAGLYKRSLIVLRLLTDRNTGGIIAAPEMDPEFKSCGGYGYCWPRDGAYNAHALDLAGQHKHAREFYDWALEGQEAVGGWYQRYRVTWQLAPTWGLVQFDETGAVVWALCRHIQLTRDLDYGRNVFSALLYACEYMQRALDRETGLAPITTDLWEERAGINTYACASTWGGFYEFSQLAALLGEHTQAQRWAEAAARLKSAIETHLWDAERGHFVRGLKLKLPTQSYQRSDFLAPRARKKPGEIIIRNRRWPAQPRDPVLDSAVLGLCAPFGVFAADDPRMRSTADAIATRLTSPAGGICRYDGDPYRGGNPWIICTLWLAWFDLLAGNEARARTLYAWALEHRTALDLLPEQLDRESGAPCWVVPLGWSHAMFLIITHALAERGLL